MAGHVSTFPWWCQAVSNRPENMQPRLTIVIPVYNSRDTVRDALRSVETQTFRDFEVLAVDDASTDDTVGILEKEFLSQPNRRVITLAENGGPATARNRGISEAKGEWIAFLDADDFWLPHKLEMQMIMADRFPHAAMIYGAAIPFDFQPAEAHEALSRVRQGGEVKWRVLEDFVAMNTTQTSTVIVRKNALEAVGGFDEQFRGPEDYDLWLRITARFPVLYLNEAFSRYRHTPGSLSLNEDAFLPQVLRVLEKAFGKEGVLHEYGDSLKRQAMAHQYLCCSWAALERGLVTRGLKLFLGSLGLWRGPFGPLHGGKWVRTRLLAFMAKKMLSRR